MPEPAKCRQWLEKNFPDVFARMTLGECHIQARFRPALRSVRSDPITSGQLKYSSHTKTFLSQVLVQDEPGYDHTNLNEIILYSY